MSESTQPQIVPKKILVVAPQPFFQDRGTPIAVRLLVEELARLGFNVHLLVFHEGEDVFLPGVTQHRIPSIPGVKNIPPSISWKKIVCDVVLFFKVIQLLRHHRFDLIHAVEESAFIAGIMKMIFGTPYIYDMDSSLAIQLADKLPFLSPVRPLLEMFEKTAVRGSVAVVAVCKELEDIVLGYAPGKHVVRLEDISMLDTTVSGEESLRERFAITGPIMLYVGNLESYQGIDLLLESFQIALQKGCPGNIVIIGGTKETIAAYETYSSELGISEKTFFCGPRPLELLAHYLGQADILLSPRVQGNNTPMKLYSYLDSGKPVLATRLITHTQVLTDEFACLVEPVKESMAEGIMYLVDDFAAGRRMGEKGKEVVRENYSLEAFRKKLEPFYAKVVSDISKD